MSKVEVLTYIAKIVYWPKNVNSSMNMNMKKRVGVK